MKRKVIFKIIIINIIALGALITFGTKLYVSFNYDVKIRTDSGGSFYIFSTSFYEYYLVNSSLGVKTKTIAFDVKSDEFSDEQLQQLKEIEKIDSKFIVERQYSEPQYYVFFYENYIFYTRYYGESSSRIPEEDRIDMQENIYKYNIDTKEIEQIKMNKDDYNLGYKSDGINVELEALYYLYPNLKEAISSKCGVIGDRVYSFGSVYLGKGRILFSTFFSSSTRGTTEHLYEYLPETGETKKITTTSASLAGVEIIK